jgi:DNA-binding MarR family transcriptional regulator
MAAPQVRSDAPVITNHARHERQILNWIEDRRPVTQRRLASDLGIALGLTNLLLRRLVKKGWLRARRISPKRIRYVVTPKGAVAKARLTRAYFLESLKFYRESRDRMRERLAVASAEIVAANGNGAASRTVVFYGFGPDTEVAYICLQQTPLQLVGVVDPVAVGRFFHLEVSAPSALSGQSLSGRPFARLIVMPLQAEGAVRTELSARGVPERSVFWL